MPTSSRRLYVATDVAKVQWLKYILQEFRRINGLDADIEVIGLNDSRAAGQSGPVIVYAQQYHEAATISLVNRSAVVPQHSIEHLGDGLYVAAQTTTPDSRFTLPYDLFWNAFIFLSRLEEYLHFKNGRNTYSHCLLHPRRNKDSLAVPIVNLLFNQLESQIREKFPELPFVQDAPPKIELSHDVDYLSKTPQYLLKQTILNCYDVGRFIHRWRDTGRRVKKVGEFLFSRPSLWCFEYWENLEKRFDLRSTFYVYAKAIPKTLRTWFIDPNYDVLDNPKLQQKLRQLVADGFDVGLHGSISAAVDEALLMKEKEVLEGVIGRPVDRVRQHWLRFNEEITPHIHDRLFRYDSTLGWNDRVGFRNGCASLFHPYDHRNDRPFDYLEIPLVIMDFNIYQSLGVEHEAFVNQAFKILDALKSCKSVRCSVCWHQQVCNPDYEWHHVYELILQRIADGIH